MFKELALKVMDEILEHRISKIFEHGIVENPDFNGPRTKKKEISLTQIRDMISKGIISNEDEWKDKFRMTMKIWIDFYGKNSYYFDVCDYLFKLFYKKIDKIFRNDVVSMISKYQSKLNDLIISAPIIPSVFLHTKQLYLYELYKSSKRDKYIKEITAIIEMYQPELIQSRISFHLDVSKLCPEATDKIIAYLKNEKTRNIR